MNQNIFKSNAIIRGEISLYYYQDAISLIKWCSQKNISVLGIDAFQISDNYTRPLMEHSIDFSEKGAGKDNQQAIDFLKARKKLNLVYEIVY